MIDHFQQSLLQPLEGTFFVAQWRIDVSLNSISRSDQTIRVAPKTMAVLQCLAAQPGEVVTRASLMETVWAGTIVGDNALRRIISELRRIFEDDPRTPEVIETISKTGYRLIAPVTFAEPPSHVAPPSATPASQVSSLTRRRVGMGLLLAGLLGADDGDRLGGDHRRR